MTKVDEGNTITDFDDEEVQRKITISTAVAAIEWKKSKLNLLDTRFPGSTSSSMTHWRHWRLPTRRSVLVDAVAGVEVQTEKTWGFADQFALPRAIVINKLDRERSSFERALESVQEHFGRTAIPRAACRSAPSGISPVWWIWCG